MINPKFRQHPYRALGQMLVAVGYMLVVLMMIGRVSHSTILSAVGVSSLAASAFMVVFFPSLQASQPHRILIGYIIGLSSGVIWHTLMASNPSFGVEHLPAWKSDWVSLCAISTTMFTMMMLNLSHPPVVGLSIGLVLMPWEWPTLLVILFAALTLAGLKRILNPYLHSLMD